MSDPVERALDSLRSVPSDPWRDPALLGRRRRRGRWSVAGAAAIVAVAGVIIVPRLGGSGSGPTALPAATVRDATHIGSAVQLVANVSPLRAADPSAVTSVARAEQDFTTALLRALPDTGNVSASPASLALALSMLQNGARGTTASEIAAALHTSSLSAASQDAGWAGLTAAWTSAARAAGIQLSSANSLWVQHDLTVDNGFLAALGRYYASGVWQVDFAHNMPAALAAMNTWTSQHTSGRIQKLFDSLDPSTVLVLANAVYFHAAWQVPFDANVTEPATFHSPTGAHRAQFMSGPSPKTVVTPTYSAAQLPYRGGRFAALVVMPTSGSLSSFTASLTGAKLRSIASSLPTSSAVKLPRFTTTTTTDLVPVLKSLGIRTAFTDTADFSALSPTPLALGNAIQRVYLKVGEKGTEAAAVTGLGMIAMSAPVPGSDISFDHPFLFLIRDTTTGAVLFASKVVDPAS